MTSEDIEAAERVMGLRYDPSEREMVAETIEDQIRALQARRGFALGDATPATRFDPRLPGFEMPRQAALRLPAVDAPLPETDADIAFAPAGHLAHWIATGAITSVRLVEIYLDRIARLDPDLRAFALVTPERARAEARAMDALTEQGVSLGPLHGVPYGLKDLFDTEGLPTGWGAEPYAGRVPERDAAVATRLRQAGAVMLGKTSLGALAYGDLWDGGRTMNPWNPDEGSSGSSAGSAAAVAAGLCGFAIGTETLGSIVSPSERCGTTGLRPTFGRVSRAGAMPLAWSLDKVGPICRDVADCARVLAVLNGGDPADRGSIDAPFGWDAAQDLTGLRLGWLPAAFKDAREVERAALETAKGLGCEMVELSLPEMPLGSLTQILFAEAAAAFEDLTLTDRDDELTWQAPEAWPNLFRRARFLSAVDHVQLDRLRLRAMEALDALFQKADVIVGPMRGAEMLVATNFTGHPCLHLRAGFEMRGAHPPGALGRGAPPPPAGPERRVPAGISLWGPLFDEGKLLTVGRALEAALAVHDLRPEI